MTGPLRRRVARLGRSAGLVLTAGPSESQALATAVRAQQWGEVADVVPAAASVGILGGSAGADVSELLDLAAALPDARPIRSRRQVEVEVCFDGQDLDGVAEVVGMSRRSLVATLEETALEVGWLGFMPGFPYLLGLPPALRGVPRLERPRPAVPNGAVALAGGYAGIYPRATPGGWRVLGRTTFVLFDHGAPPYARLQPGDSVRLRAVPAIEPLTGAGDRAREPLTASDRWRRLVVTDPGVLTLVQDRGRLGVAHLGVPPAGPADPQSHAVANAAVGNAPEAATLEMTVSGPTLRFTSATFVAVVGDCPTWIDGREMPPAAVQLVGAGQSLTIGAMRSGARAYLGIAGGVEVDTRLGSRSSDSVTGIPPGPLRAGDEIGLGEPGRPRGRFERPGSGDSVLRLELGPDEVDDTTLRRLLDSDWTVHPESNRVGVRLVPEVPEDSGGSGGTRHSVDSRATVTGAVQLPPDGCPVLLGPDHGTVGGYLTVGVLTPASQGRAGRLRPGDRIRFEASDLGDPGGDLVPAEQLVHGWMAADAGVLG